ncbi:hypothetical protein [Paenibacillus ehimensis]|uniref:hypothetical protein n=1 Tax=Paenibacillus ehimensis TaxID=79264 RepID=UPI000472BFDF|nr:hypothetical protein [Paenibacillus ehimensis]
MNLLAVLRSICLGAMLFTSTIPLCEAEPANMFIKRNSENFRPATPDEFYAKLTDYKEFENATLNVRKVTKYGDVKNCIEDLVTIRGEILS